MALIGTATGVNFNATGDTAISITDPGDGKYVITGICVSNASANPASGFRGWLYAEEGGVDPIGAPMNFGSNLPGFGQGATTRDAGVVLGQPGCSDRLDDYLLPCRNRQWRALHRRHRHLRRAHRLKAHCHSQTKNAPGP